MQSVVKIDSSLKNSVLSFYPWITRFSLLGSVFLASACSGPQIHKDLSADPQIMTRSWTRSSQVSFLAGDHGNEFSHPVVSDNTLIFGNQTSGLVSLYPHSNQQRWVVPIKDGVLSELAIGQNSVFFGGGDGYFYSVDVNTGRVNWRYEIRNSVASRPALSGGRVFVTTLDDTVYALDAGTGKWLWHYRRRSVPLATIMGASSPLVDQNEVIVGLSDGFLVGLSLEEGHLKWERRLHFGSKFTDVNAHPTLDQGIIYIPSYDGALYALQRTSGNILWRFDAGGSRDVTVDGQRLILPSSDGNVYALQKENGKVLWKFPLDSGTPTRVAVTEDYVIVGSSYRYLYVIDKNTGQGLYRFNAGHNSGFRGAPVYDATHQRVYVLSGAGNLYAFQLKGNAKAKAKGDSAR